jgi:hypothetical protein
MILNNKACPGVLFFAIIKKDKVSKSLEVDK